MMFNYAYAWQLSLDFELTQLVLLSIFFFFKKIVFSIYAWIQRGLVTNVLYNTEADRAVF